MAKPNVNVTVGGPKNDHTSIYKTFILRENVSFASQVGTPDTKYVVKWNFDLGGEEAVVAENCILEFDGGSLTNGTLIGDGTQIYAEKVAIFSEITIGGEWNVPDITTAWFKDSFTKDDIIRECMHLCSANFFNRVIIEKGDHWVSVPQEGGTAIVTKSNTELFILGNIRTRGNAYKVARTLAVSYVDNVLITGSGYIYGDIDSHDYSDDSTTYEKCHTILINESTNITIDGLNIRNATGDGISVNFTSSENDNIVIRNFTIENCRRQGITLNSTNSLVENGHIKTIRGTLPQGGIDIENVHNTDGKAIKRNIVRNLLIEDCTYGFMATTSNSGTNQGIFEFYNIEVRNVARGFSINRYMYNVSIRNCKIQTVPGKQPAISYGSRGPVYTTNIYKQNVSYAKTSTIENCDFSVDTSNIPEDYDLNSIVCLDTKYSVSVDNAGSVKDCIINCPEGNAIIPGTKTKIVNNKIIARGFGDDTDMSGAIIANNSITLQNVGTKGEDGYLKAFLKLKACSAYNNTFTIQCPLIIYTCNLTNNRFSVSLDNYDFEEEDAHLIKMQLSNNICDNYFLSEMELDYIGIHTSATVSEQYSTLFANNFFVRSLNLVDYIGGSGKNNVVFVNNTIGKEVVSGDKYMRARRVPIGVRIMPENIIFPSRSEKSLVNWISSGGIDTTKIYNQNPFTIGSDVYIYSGDTIIDTSESRATIPGNNLKEEGIIDARSIFNLSEPLVSDSPVYLVFFDKGNNAAAARTSSATAPIYSQSLPNSADGYVYIYLGVAIAGYTIEVHKEHPIYVFKNGKLQYYS